MYQVYDINLLKLLEFGFAITINLNKYQSKKPVLLSFN